MKIVAVANAHALAHVSRLLEIAKILKMHEHEIVFAGYGKFLQIARDAGFEIEVLPYISIEQIIKAVRSQKLNELYRFTELESFIKAEIDFLKRVKPDLVLIDNRPTARTSADYCGIKTVSVLNVHMSSFRKLPFFSPGDYMGLLGFLDPIETKIECYFYDRFVMNDLNKVRKKMGLKPYFGNQHEEGDLSLFADIPEFNPVSHLANHTRYVGPITWHNDFPAPACLDKLEKNRKTIYVSLGSESLEGLVEELGELTSLGVQIIVACGKLPKQWNQDLPPHFFLEEYVNTDKVLTKCDLVCCHGGNGTLYQALAFGLPVVAVATHAEQYIGAKRIEQLGLGRALTLDRVRKKGILVLKQALAEVLYSSEIRNRTIHFAEILQQWQGAKTAAALIEDFNKS
ncbi:hypothetical protein GO003_013130 [Methylicorpusculum oleiharenae]|uniref:glycosyltransferase n=1 Tax=Methylicorpusculum oleiharenae TaxID=1338687 RepID=UPI00135A42AD|nr:nucleotide disphospho-sugar-binding domain-containing protein [Methylicorpusculum oleiharenae]MCD2451335.1 hypothetical protein [Methylicorpusculum oleiharenae]